MSFIFWNLVCAVYMALLIISALQYMYVNLWLYSFIVVSMPLTCILQYLDFGHLYLPLTFFYPRCVHFTKLFQRWFVSPSVRPYKVYLCMWLSCPGSLWRCPHPSWAVPLCFSFSLFRHIHQRHQDQDLSFMVDQWLQIDWFTSKVTRFSFHLQTSFPFLILIRPQREFNN